MIDFFNTIYGLATAFIFTCGLVIIIFRITNKYCEAQIGKDGIKLNTSNKNHYPTNKIDKHYNQFISDFNNFACDMYDFLVNNLEIDDKIFFGQIYSLHIKANIRNYIENCVRLNHIPARNTKEHDEYINIHLAQIMRTCEFLSNVVSKKYNYETKAYNFGNIAKSFCVLIERYR